MTAYAIRPEDLQDTLAAALGERANRITIALGEVTVHVNAAHYHSVMQTLQSAPGCQFEQLVDLCGVDYSTYREVGTDGPRFGVTVHLLSVSLNQRVRVKVLCPDDELPLVASVNDLWNSANWYEREAFDMFGVRFTGHPDLRRILMWDGFKDHPMRKDYQEPDDYEYEPTPHDDVCDKTKAHYPKQEVKA